jgi:hypothetical protein
MHKLFSVWYRLAEVEPKGDDLPKRWAAVEAVVGSIDKPRAIEVARLYLGSASASLEFKDQFASIFQKNDPAFPMRANELELRVLAGAVVAQYLETQRSHIGDALALAVISGAAPSFRQSVLLPEIVTIAQDYAFQESQKVRSYSPAAEVKATVLKAEQLLNDVKTPAAQNNLPGTVEALAAPLQKLYLATTAVAKSSNDAVSHLNDLVASLVEQSNILWWVFAGSSRDVEKSFSSIELASASLIAGKELADLTEVLPGPVAVPAVLDKILSVGRPAAAAISFEAAITGVAGEWRQKCLDGQSGQLDDLSPIHLALRKAGEGVAWKKSFESISGIKVSKLNLAPLTLAIQMYNERLLQKAVRE